MTEEEARAWLAAHFPVSRGTWERLERYVALLLEGATEQNLIADSTREHVWARHIVDSAQLLLLAEGVGDGDWIDLGSGAGLPGMVVACLSDRPVLMVESRRKRIAFLEDCARSLGLHHTSIFGGRVETVPRQAAAIISARAYAPLQRLLESALHLGDKNTLWVLPKGRNAEIELEAARTAWQGAFHVERSVTDAESAIIVARGVEPVARRAKA